nr:THUMP domain-containing protein 2 isoform X2 [Monopterus albus]
MTIDRVSELKAAERLFLLVKQEPPVRLSAHTNPAKAASVLQSRLLGDKNQWTRAALTWSRLQGELEQKKNRITSALTPSTALGGKMNREEGRGGEGQREEEDEQGMETRKRTGEQREEENGNRSLGTRAQTVEKKRKREKEEREAEGMGDVQKEKEEETSGETCFLEKKSKRDDEEDDEESWGATQDSNSEKNVEKDKASERERKREEEDKRRIFNSRHGVISGTDFNGGGTVWDHATAGRHHNVESSGRRKVVNAASFAVISVENVKSTGGGGKALLQPELAFAVAVSFRISCKCTGSVSRYFSSQEVSKVIGVGLSRLLGWKADLKNPQLEVNVYLSDDHCLLGIPLTRLPLANRSYIKTTGLRSTVAWAMASLAQIQPGFCVVDPMCGVGTILIEAAQEHKATCFLGMDIDDGQLQKANDNVEFAELGNRIHLLKASSVVLPLPSGSVDAVVCDLPFGRKFGTKTDMAAKLPAIVNEMERVLSIGGTLVLLLSPQLSYLLKELLAQKHTGPTSNQGTKLQTGIQDSPSSFLPSTKQQSFQIHYGVQPSYTRETDELCHGPLPPLSSLKHQATLRVSLGAIDGLIHKYVKIVA